MNFTASLDRQFRTLWIDTTGWVSSHSLQIILGVAAATLVVLVLMGVKWLGMRICRSDPEHSHWRTVLGRVFAGTRMWFMIPAAARLVASYAQAPEGVATTINTLFVIAATLQVALWVRELILGIIEHRAGGVEESSGLGSAIGLIRLLATIAIFLIAIVVVLDNLGVNVTGLIAGLGIGGIAIGLAAQGIFADLFAALAIIFDKPFRRGNSVRWDTTTGTVENIGLKSTRVRAITGEEVVISNTNLLGKELHNMARLNRRRIVQQFGIIYQTPVELCARIPGDREGGRQWLREMRVPALRDGRLRRLQPRLRVRVRCPLRGLAEGVRRAQPGADRAAEAVQRGRDRVRLSHPDQLHRRAGRDADHALSGGETRRRRPRPFKGRGGLASRFERSTRHSSANWNLASS